MIHARVGQLYGADSGGLHRLCDKCIDVVELRLTQLDVHTAQNVDGVDNGLPVEHGIIVNLQIQIPVQRLDRLIRATLEIRLVDLIIASFLIYVQIRIAEHADQFDLARILIYVADNVHVRVVPLAQGIVPAVNAEQRHGPEPLHTFHFLVGQVRVRHLRHVDVGVTLNRVQLLFDGHDHQEQ